MALQPEALGGGLVFTSLPLSVQQVIEARLDRLTPAGQELIQVAAVFGQPFTLALLQDVAQIATEQVIRPIEEWLERSLVTLPRFMPADPVHLARAAAHLYARCRWAGVTPRSGNDCLIACCAIEAGEALLQEDGDFSHIARIEPKLRLFPD
jgi:hypothetical protein